MSRTSQIGFGAKGLLNGFSFLFTNPSLWIWALLPFGIAILILFLSLGVFIQHISDIYQFFITHLGLTANTQPEGLLATILWGLTWLFKQILKLFVFLLGLILLSVLSFLVYLIVSAPFLDLLAEKVGVKAKGVNSPPFQWRRFFKGIGQSIWIEIQKAILFLSLPLLLWVLHFIPVVGSLFFIVATCLFGMWALGFANVDYPMSHQLFPLKTRLKFARQSKYYLIGFGLPFLVPFAPLLLQAPMVVGGTLLYHELKDSNSGPPA